MQKDRIQDFVNTALKTKHIICTHEDEKKKKNESDGLWSYQFNSCFPDNKACYRHGVLYSPYPCTIAIANI